RADDLDVSVVNAVAGRALCIRNSPPPPVAATRRRFAHAAPGYRDRTSTPGASPPTSPATAGWRPRCKGFILFARSQPDTAGKLLAHAYSYEHLELASYRLLALVANRADDVDTAGSRTRSPSRSGRWPNGWP